MVVVFFALAATYSAITPLFESPDEVWHYAYVSQVAHTGQLPVQDPGQLQPWAHEGSQAPLYYLLAALITAPIPDDDLPSLLVYNPHADIGVVMPDGNANMLVHTGQESWPWKGAVFSVHTARLFSALLATGTVLTVYALGRVVWPERPAFALLAMTFVAFNPMFLFSAGSVSNDAMITLAASLSLWQLASLVTMEQDEPPLWRYVVLGLLVGLTVLSKLSGVAMVGLVGLALLWRGFRRRSWRTALLGNAIVGIMVVAVAGWWYLRNHTLYGDWTGIRPILSIMSPRALAPTFSQWLVEASGFLQSFWGVFGHFSVLMPSAIYLVLCGVLAIGGIGFAVSFLPNQSRRLPLPFRQTWGMLFLWCGLVLLALIRYTWLIPSSQGRLFFPAIASLAILWAAGWTVLIPSRLHVLPALVMIPIAIWVPFGVIAPAYARPAPISELPPTAQPLNVTFGDEVTLLGYEVGRSAVQPGDALGVQVYWRCDHPMGTDYSVFVQLLDENDLIVAQRDVYPGPGVFPTSQWKAGEQFGDTYVLRLPATAFAPAQAHLVIGLYDHTTGTRLPISAGGNSVSLAQIAIQPRPSELPNPQDLRFADDVGMVGYALDRRQVASGDRVTLTLYWQASGTPAERYKVFVHLLDDRGNRVAQDDSEPQAGLAPTSSWRPGQTIVDRHTLEIPAQTPAGAYRFVVGMYHIDTGQRLPLLYNNGQQVQTDLVVLCGIRVAPPTSP